ncbi:hypothetical protein AYI68_g1221 [Smittium mucronatum]|uniref:GOST seven transmembrane domain-containing protein n=1 Tax=Smittium mucronatum TaxID=133383 RepID=A0A1R0H5X3_9FUNG|nr:hypothetical protein AYI68_g1221 [Smittium mucronatum]
MLLFSSVRSFFARFIVLLALVLTTVQGETAILSSTNRVNLKCTSISAGSSSKPSNITLNFVSMNNGNITMLIFNYLDSDQFGLTAPKDSEDSTTSEGEKYTICNYSAIQANLCTADDYGLALIKNPSQNGSVYQYHAPIYSDFITTGESGFGFTFLERANWKSSNPEGSDADWQAFWQSERKNNVPLKAGLNTGVVSDVFIQWEGPKQVSVTYTVTKSGYYCVDAASNSDFIAKALWRNGHGFIPASEYVKVNFYRTLTAVYMILFISWAYLSYKVWYEVLPLQHFIWSLIGIMAINMSLASTFWTRFNSTGNANNVLAILMILFEAARNSMSFFLLLVVSLGWGIVRPTLGKTMKKCALLFFLHFLSGCIYGGTEVFRDQNDFDGAPLYAVLPISICTTIFYVWIMKGVVATTRILETRKQTFKLQMFNKMWRLLLINVFIFFVFFCINITFAVMTFNDKYVDTLWRYKWLFIDGWLNIQFLGSFMIILYWWMPTENNHRYGLEQLAHDEGDAWERGPSHDGHAMMLADESDFQRALEEADQVADSFVNENRTSIHRLSDSENGYTNINASNRNVFVLDDDEEEEDVTNTDVHLDNDSDQDDDPKQK